MAAMKHVSILGHGVKLHCVEMGEGPLVIFCHGFPGHWSNWMHQLQAAATAGFKALALDMRGYGESDRPANVDDYNMDHQIADLLAVLTHYQVEDAAFVGQDFGAPLVWNMALRHPTKVSAVIGVSVPFDHDYFGRSCLGHLKPEELNDDLVSGLLVASPIHPPSVGFKCIAEHQFLHAHYFQQAGPADRELGFNAREFLSRLYWGLSGEGSLGDWAQHRADETQYLDVLPPAPELPWSWLSVEDMDVMENGYLAKGPETAFSGGLSSYRVADINWHIGEEYAAMNVTVPALFIAGSEDPVIKAADESVFDRMKQRVLDLRGIEVIAGAGHFIQMERPQKTSNAIIKFITSLSSE